MKLLINLKIFSCSLFFSINILAQIVYGPVTTDLRRDLYSTDLSPAQSSGLFELNSVLYTGCAPQLSWGSGSELDFYRALYQWNIDDSQIPDGSEIESVNLSFSVWRDDFTWGFALGFYSISQDLNNPELQQIFDFMNNYQSNQLFQANETSLFQFNLTFDAPHPLITAIQSSLESDRFILGIREGSPFFNNHYYKIYNNTVKLKITFVPPNKFITLDQRLSNNSQVGKLRKWEGNQFTPYPYIDPGTPVSFPVSSNQSIQGDQTIYSNEKYFKWTRNTADEPDILNHHSFTIQANDFTVTSQFNPTNSTGTIKNNLELSSTNDGTIQFKDPWLIDYADPMFGNTLRNRGMKDTGPDKLEFKSRPSPFYPDYTTNYNGDVYKGVFLDQSGPPLWNPPYYSVAAISPQPITINGRTHNFYFQNWGGTNVQYEHANQLETGVVFTNEPAEAIANLKGTQLSNDQNAYVNNSQRKFVRTPDDYYHHVYESMDRVWYEVSHDNGATWELMNNGKPLDDDKGKLPSIDYNVFTNQYGTYYQIAIVYQEKYGNGYKIRLKHFQKGLVPEAAYSYLDDETIFTTTANYNSSNADPVISLDYGSYFTAVYTDHVYPGGLYCRRGWLNYLDGIHLYGTSNTYLNGTNALSYHPTIGVVKEEFHYLMKLAWEQYIDESTSQIFYGVVNGTSMEAYEPISDYSGFGINFRPSILATADGARVCWIGYRTGEGECWDPEQMCFSEYSEQKVVFADPGYKWYYWNFGDNVQSTYVNRSTPRYVIAWGEGDATPVQFVDSWDLGGTIYSPEGLTGKYVQVCNGNDRREMRVMAFNTTAQPYYFNSSQCYNTPKIKSLAIGAGREGIITKDSARFYFALGDLKVNDQPVTFIEVDDTVSIYSKQRLNELLVSEPFNLNDNTNFIYSVQYGITDSSAAVNVLDNDDFVNFKVELRDDQTGELLGLFDNIIYTESNVAQYNNIAYQVNTQGIGDRTVKLRLVTNNNFDPRYSIADRYAEGNALLKTNFKQVNFQGSLAVDNYDLSQNYPNPFNPTTTINYQLKEDGLVTLKLYDILGAEVKTFVNEEKSQGRYVYNFNASDLASGVYIYQLRVNEYVSSKKLMLVK